MSLTAAAYLFGTIGMAVALLAARYCCRNSRVRLVLLLLPILLLLHLAYLVAVPVCPGIFSFLIPYIPVGDWATTDTDGNPCKVTIQAKARSSTIPPGEYPRIRLESSSIHGTGVYVKDTDWRLGLGTITPIPGGVEIYQTDSNGWGARFLLHRDHWVEETIAPKAW